MPPGPRMIVVPPAIIVELWSPMSYVVPPITISSNVEVNEGGDEVKEAGRGVGEDGVAVTCTSLEVSPSHSSLSQLQNICQCYFDIENEKKPANRYQENSQIMLTYILRADNKPHHIGELECHQVLGKGKFHNRCTKQWSILAFWIVFSSEIL
jgi:hypothetical protein